jgi:Family of unknown function (DUF6318)
MRLVRRRVLPLAAVALSAIVGLTAACTSGHGADPGTIPVPSGTPTTTPTVSLSPTRTGPLTTGPNMSPGETPPTFPAEYRQHDATGALAVALYYYQAFDWGYATNDAQLIQQISAPNCTACTRYISTINELAAHGGYIQRGRIRVLSGKLITGTFRFKSDYVAEVLINEEPVIVHSPSAAPSTAEPALMSDPSLIFVSWTASGWKIVEVASL